jgi:uncharacterized Fe-S cluster-containing radical SAM superfamily protein
MKALEFLWLELTNKCNRECKHCYAMSSPSWEGDTLTPDDYTNLIREAHSLGCRQIQFIGGEPTIVKELPEYIRLARWLDYQFIELYTNGVRMPPGLLPLIKEAGVNVAISFYSRQPDIMDKIMGAKGSHEKVLATIQAVRDAGVPLRIGIIEMEENAGLGEDTKRFLAEHGVYNAGIDHIRPFGRGNRFTEKENPCDGLCGQCWKGKACVTAEGKVLPCIMSRDRSLHLGDLNTSTLSEIVVRPHTKEVRGRILLETMRPTRQACWPDQQCWPNMACPPDKGMHARPVSMECRPVCGPVCHPSFCQPYCEPSCGPHPHMEVQSVNMEFCDPNCGPVCNPSHCGPYCSPSCHPTCYPSACPPLAGTPYSLQSEFCDPQVSCRPECTPSNCQPYCKPNRSFASEDCPPNCTPSCNPYWGCKPTQGCPPTAFTAGCTPTDAECHPDCTPQCNPSWGCPPTRGYQASCYPRPPCEPMNVHRQACRPIWKGCEPIEGEARLAFICLPSPDCTPTCSPGIGCVPNKGYGPCTPELQPCPPVLPWAGCHPGPCQPIIDQGAACGPEDCTPTLTCYPGPERIATCYPELGPPTPCSPVKDSIVVGCRPDCFPWNKCQPNIFGEIACHPQCLPMTKCNPDIVVPPVAAGCPPEDCVPNCNPSSCYPVKVEATSMGEPCLPQSCQPSVCRPGTSQ